jgi:hypothetical protein
MLDTPVWRYPVVMPVCKKEGNGGREGYKKNME